MEDKPLVFSTVSVELTIKINIHLVAKGRIQKQGLLDRSHSQCSWKGRGNEGFGENGTDAKS